jgi:hypothetical protein
MKEKVKIGELNFEFISQSPEDGRPVLEIENDASMVFVKVDKQKARELKSLLEKYIAFEPSSEIPR